MKTYKLATALTIGTFCLTALTGVLIFLEITPGGIRATHEWMSLAFVAAGLFHIVTHKTNFFKYFKERYKILIFLIFIAGGIIFASSMSDIYSAGASFDKIVNAKIEYVAPLFYLTPEEMVKKLNHMNFEVSADSQSLNEIAKANKVETYLILESLFKEE